MNRALPLLLLSLLQFCCFAVLAAEKQEPVEEAPIELERILVAMQTGLTYEQEVTLRIIRQGYKKKRSAREKDRDVWVCWFDRGSKFLRCGRNGDMWAHRSRYLSKNRPPSDEAIRDKDGYGGVLVTTFPADRRWLEQTLAELPGSDAFDVEFIAMVVAGQRPPLEIPGNKEMDRFTSIWKKVGNLEQHVDPEDPRLSVIDDAEFSVIRYQHISELIETYQSIKAEIDERVMNSSG